MRWPSRLRMIKRKNKSRNQRSLDCQKGPRTKDKLDKSFKEILVLTKNFETLSWTHQWRPRTDSCRRRNARTSQRRSISLSLRFLRPQKLLIQKMKLMILKVKNLLKCKPIMIDQRVDPPLKEKYSPKLESQWKNRT